ncbi:MAG: aminoacyl-tRNA hydrolase [Pseudomonadota bacterium]|nr:aminoacyl-tRNA hydrolase [Pseudomonadota bacterium]
MNLLVGLGNPGTKHLSNRHNAGFMAIDAIQHKYQFPIFRKKFLGYISEGFIEGDKVVLLKPNTFMNESGKSVVAAAKFFSLDSEKILVFHDDIDLYLGQIKVKFGGGYAGHNGLKSIGQLYNSNFGRVRIGIGHPGDKDKVIGHVLKDFLAADQRVIEHIFQAIAEALPSLLYNGNSEFMAKVAAVMNSKINKRDNRGNHGKKYVVKGLD